MECRDFHHLNVTNVCQFVNTTDDCQLEVGFIDYIHSMYCLFPNYVPLFSIILFLWMVFLFLSLAVVAEDFFCPALVVIAKCLRLSDNIAGVTLLAFGNGAPDVFSAIAAVGSMKNGNAGLAIGALFGAGVFVTSFVAGFVAFTHPFEVMQRPLLTVIVFYLGAVFMAFYILYSKRFILPFAISFIGIYVVYVITILLSRWIYQRRRNNNIQTGPESVEEESQDDPEQAGIEDVSHIIHNIRAHNFDESLPEFPAQMDDESDESTPLLASVDHQVRSRTREFLDSINPIDCDAWPTLKWYWKVYEIFKAPANVIFLLTVPVVDYDSPHNNWSKYLNSLHCLTVPVTSFLIADYTNFLRLIDNTFPIGATVSLGGFVLAVLVLATSNRHQPPRYHILFALAGFASSVIWVQAVANEIVNLLQTFGVVLDLGDSVLGLTVLAWGNSIGDLVTNTATAKQGFPRMAISACYGGPMFNLLIGLGVSFTIEIIKDGPVKLEVSTVQLVLCFSLMASLLLSLLLVNFMKFYLG